MKASYFLYNKTFDLKKKNIQPKIERSKLIILIEEGEEYFL
jgi:hypothetical protein